MKLKELKKKAWYKEQKRFVAYDGGPEFKYRYGVMGLTEETFKMSRWFMRESDAAAFCADIVAATERLRLPENAPDPVKAVAAKTRWLKDKKAGKRSKMRRDCAFKRGRHG